jgi:membrane protease YdiL (CAAX protease family)
MNLINVLFLGYIVFLLLSIKLFIKQNKVYSWPFFISFCILSPISEECMFRDTLLSATKNLFNEYNIIVNAVLFSSVHLLNIIYLPNWTVKIVAYQAFLSFYMGYYFALLNNIMYSIFLHIFFNTTIYTVSVIYCKYYMHIIL